MAPSQHDDDDVFERLKRPADSEILREREAAVTERVQAQYVRSQKRLAELIENNSTLPVHIRSLHVEGAKNTRGAFLKRVFDPVLSKEKQKSYTLEGVMGELQKAVAKLHQFEIFHPNISITFDTPPPSLALQDTPLPPTAFDVTLNVTERPRLMLKSGTDVGNTEGTGYITASMRNLLGGAESASFSASTGTRTRSAYDAYLTTPLFSNPDLNAFAAAYATSRSNHDFASHEEISKGGRIGLSYVAPETRDKHELIYEGTWRRITDLWTEASVSIRNEAGDSVKSAIKYSFTRDWRYPSFFPSRGYFFKSTVELAGRPCLGGDIHHLRNESEFQFSIPILPGTRITNINTITNTSTIPSLEISDARRKSPIRRFLEHTTLTTSVRSGIILPLSSAPTRLPDRFQLGGPTTLRSFRECGLGPHDGKDSLGGDIYLAGSTSLLFPIPHLGPDMPVRFQIYCNGGRLLAWTRQAPRGAPVGSSHPPGNGVDIPDAIRRLVGHGAGLPSTAAGIGLVYAHSIARVELNFGVPVFMRAGERSRKGFQFGVGISIM